MPECFVCKRPDLPRSVGGDPREPCAHVKPDATPCSGSPTGFDAETHELIASDDSLWDLMFWDPSDPDEMIRTSFATATAKPTRRRSSKVTQSVTMDDKDIDDWEV